jgi:DNA-binding response OmpR family regulator
MIVAGRCQEFVRTIRPAVQSRTVAAMCAQVLIAEDDRMQAELLRRYVEREGHGVTVVHNGWAAVDEARRGRPDLLILDLMLPEMDGLTVCRTLRAESGIAVLMLTARASEDDLVRGFGNGADDYLTKPYSPRELVVRMNSLLRRVARAPDRADQVVRVGPLTLDPAARTVTMDGTAVACTRGEFEILHALASRPGQAFTRQQLLECASRIDGITTSRTVDVHVMNLRRKIEPDPRRPVHLVTVFGVGYKFAEVSG